MMSLPHRGTLLSHPQHAFKYQMRSEISLNFSANSESFNSSSSIAASTLFGRCRFNQQKRTQMLQHSLPAIAFQSAKHAQLHSSSPKKGAYHRHFSISRMKPISVSILFSGHALPLRIFSLMQSMQPATGRKRKGDASGERESLWAEGTF